MKFHGPFNEPEFLEEVWALFGVGTFIILLRYAVRIRTVGLRGFQGDDYMMFAVLLTYAGDAIAVTLAYLYGTNLDWSQSKMIAMGPADRQKVEIGTRMQLLAWYTYSILIWSLKGCMLFFYHRLTLGLESSKLIKWLAAACAVTWLACFITFSCQCFPIQRNWQLIPDPGGACRRKYANVWVSTFLNVITDAALLCVPLPLIWKLRIPLRRKVALCLILSTGIFVISAAIVRIIFTLQQASVLNINRWGVRETIAGIVAVNFPIIRPIFKDAFWRRGPFLVSERASRGHSSYRSTMERRKKFHSSIHHSNSDVEMWNKPGDGYNSTTTKNSSSFNDEGDEESSQNTAINIPGRPLRVMPSEDEMEGTEPQSWTPGGITVQTSYDVRPDSRAHDPSDTVSAEGIYCGPGLRTELTGNQVQIYSDRSIGGR